MRGILTCANTLWNSVSLDSRFASSHLIQARKTCSSLSQIRSSLEIKSISWRWPTLTNSSPSMIWNWQECLELQTFTSLAYESSKILNTLSIRIYSLLCVAYHDMFLILFTSVNLLRVYFLAFLWSSSHACISAKFWIPRLLFSSMCLSKYWQHASRTGNMSEK